MLFGYFQYGKTPYIKRLPLSAELNAQQAEDFLAQRRDFFYSRDGEELKKEPFYPGALSSNAVISSLEFDDPDGFLKAVNEPTNYPLYDNAEELRYLKALFSGDSNEVLIQLVEPRRVMLPKTGWLLLKQLVTGKIGDVLSPEAMKTFVEMEDVGFHPDRKLTAVYDGKMLYFKSFFQVSKIFDLGEYLVDATDETIREFLSLPCIYSENPTQDALGLTKAQRRKIATVMALGFVKKYSAQEIMRRIRMAKNNIAVSEHDGKIVFPAKNNERGTLLQFLGNGILSSYLDDEHDYEGEVTRPIRK